MQEDEQNLKKHITALENSIKDMTENAANSARLYVTDEDIAKLPCTANDTVFAVKAPQGTTLEVPDPDDGLETGQRRYRYPCLQLTKAYLLLNFIHDIAILRCFVCNCIRKSTNQQ